MPVVTALRERPRDRVAVELDGAPWRVVPAAAVVRAGLAVGRELDRPLARELARELRRAEAVGVAVRTLRHRDLSRRRLEERLAGRAVGAAAREQALAALEQAGIVDDSRVAASRARVLAERGFGDAAIRDGLVREQVDPELVEAALAALEPERERAARLVERYGRSVKTARRLASRGFDPDVVEAAAAVSGDDG